MPFSATAQAVCRLRQALPYVFMFSSPRSQLNFCLFLSLFLPLFFFILRKLIVLKLLSKVSSTNLFIVMSKAMEGLKQDQLSIYAPKVHLGLQTENNRPSIGLHTCN